MNTTALSMARRLFKVEGVPVSTQRHNMRSWVRSVKYLGKKWLIATPINTK
jgi:hypothetical protein